MKKTGIQVNTIRKVVNISVSGKMTIEDSKLFISEYNSKMGTITPSMFDLEVDCTEMQVLTPDMHEDLTNVMVMYKSTGFKHIKFQTSSPVLKMQLNRLANKAGLTSFEVNV